MKSNPAAAPVQARWFSENPDKAWGEKFFLIYTPIWILQTAMAVVFGYGKTMGDFGSIIYSLFVAAPFVVIPFLIYKEAKAGKPWYKTYWFKANLYIAIFSLLGNYYGSEYFFDVLGMVYHYPTCTGPLTHPWWARAYNIRL
jgi:cycloeucalenol cycloisomerase